MTAFPGIVSNIIEQYARSMSIMEVVVFYDRLRSPMSWRPDMPMMICCPKIIIGPANNEGTLFWAVRHVKNKGEYYTASMSTATSRNKGRQGPYRPQLTELVCMATGALIVRNDKIKSMRRILPNKGGGRTEELLYRKEADIPVYHPDPRIRDFVLASWREHQFDTAALAVVDENDSRLYFTSNFNDFTDPLPQRVMVVQFNTNTTAKDVQFEPKLSGLLHRIAVSPNAKWLSVMIMTRVPSKMDQTSFVGNDDWTSKEYNPYNPSESHIRLYTEIDGVFHQMYCSGPRGHMIMAQWFTRDSSHFIFIVDDDVVRMRLT